MKSTKQKTIDIVSSASINNGYLIVSLPNAIEPVVWRLELDQASNAAFEIKTQDTIFNLVIKGDKKSKADVIGKFDTKDEAIKALLVISDTLKEKITAPATPQTVIAKKTASVKTRTSSNDDATVSAIYIPSTTSAVKNKNYRATIALIATIFVVVAFYYNWAKLVPSTQLFEEPQQAQNATTNGEAASQTGVALSADDYLKSF